MQPRTGTRCLFPRGAGGLGASGWRRRTRTRRTTRDLVVENMTEEIKTAACSKQCTSTDVNLSSQPNVYAAITHVLAVDSTASPARSAARTRLTDGRL